MTHGNCEETVVNGVSTVLCVCAWRVMYVPMYPLAVHVVLTIFNWMWHIPYSREFSQGLYFAFLQFDQIPESLFAKLLMSKTQMRNTDTQMCEMFV